MNLIPLTTVNTHIPLSGAFLFLRAAIHSAVRVFMGEADEIAAQSLCGFCGEIFTTQRRAFFVPSLSNPNPVLLLR
jgi:hypothetical protein